MEIGKLLCINDGKVLPGKTAGRPAITMMQMATELKHYQRVKGGMEVVGVIDTEDYIPTTHMGMY